MKTHTGNNTQIITVTILEFQQYWKSAVPVGLSDNITRSIMQSVSFSYSIIFFLP